MGFNGAMLASPLRRALALAAVAALLAGALIALLRGLDAAPVDPDGARAVDTDAEAHKSADDLAELERPGPGRDAPTSGRPAPEPETLAPLAPAQPRDPLSLAIEIDPNPWLARDSVRVDTDKRATEELRVHARSKGGRTWIGEAKLLEEPRGPEVFGKVTVANLAADVVSFGRSTSDTGPAWILRLALAPGATLDWSPETPSSERTAADVGIGGSMMPSARGFYRFGSRTGLVDAAHHLELPLVLPRVLDREAVWVGAPGRAWRSFRLEPSTERIDVKLGRAGAIEVLHDGPDPGRRLTVIATALPKGETWTRGITGPASVAFTELPVSIHEVRIVEGDPKQGKIVSRLARLQVYAGESSIVDLTEETTARAYGALELHLRAPEDLLRSAKEPLQVTVERFHEHDADDPWQRAGELVASGKRRDGRVTLATKGLVPGRYRVIVDPFGTFVEATARAGETEVVDLDLNSVGWATFKTPEGFEGSYLTFHTAEADPRHRVLLHSSNRRFDPDHRQAFSPGTYVARLRALSGRSSDSCKSYPFEIRTGETTRVVLEEDPAVKVHVRAVNAATGEPVSLDLDFWVDVKATGEETNRSYTRRTSFGGDIDAITGISWTLGEAYEALVIESPESEFWIFEPIEPLRVEDGTEIVLRATAK